MMNIPKNKVRERMRQLGEVVIGPVLVKPTGSLSLLSPSETKALSEAGMNGLHTLLRRCALAVLNTGSDLDDSVSVFEKYRSFEIAVHQDEHGFELELHNAPSNAFVNNELITGIREHLFAVLRDLVFIHDQLGNEESPTERIFDQLRYAQVLDPTRNPNLAVCWGGHSISREEYDYSKDVGHMLGLYGINVCTGCGPGAMKGPMKGAQLGHFKQRIDNSLFLGVTEPGIIAAEAPNPVVNKLVIMPNIEQRLEAFVRIGHGFVVFPGGVGTVEEILYLLSILTDPNNQNDRIPLIFTGPSSSKAYWKQLEQFLVETLGSDIKRHFRVVLNDPEKVAQLLESHMAELQAKQERLDQSACFNWGLTIPEILQQSFMPTHENMRALRLEDNHSTSQHAAVLRQLFSGIVAGNVKEDGIQAVAEHGPFEIAINSEYTNSIDQLLNSFVKAHRMRLPGKPYEPCYRVLVSQP